MIRALAALVLLVPAGAAAEPRHVVRLDVGVASPVGEVGLRYRIEPDLEGSPGLEIGAGLARTGVALSLAIVQPVRTVGEGRAYPARFLAYGGASLNLMRGGLDHPLAADSEYVPDGNYVWVDLGALVETQLGRMVIALGGGLGVLVASPARPPLAADDDATAFDAVWWLDKRLAPSLWAGLGWRF